MFFPRVFATALLSLAFFSNAFAQSEPPSPLFDLSSNPTMALQLPGMSHHFNEPTAVGRKWNQTHLGIGLEWRSKWNDNGWTFKKSIGVMKDSVNTWGAYTGAVWQKQLVDHEAWSVELGGGAFLFYRAMQFDGERKLVPALLPVLSVEHKPTQIGINVLVVPQFKTNSGEMPGVIYAQFTKRF